MVNVIVMCSVTVGGYTASWAAMSYPKISAVVMQCVLAMCEIPHHKHCSVAIQAVAHIACIK